jgi:hypothetical protein
MTEYVKKIAYVLDTPGSTTEQNKLKTSNVYKNLAEAVADTTLETGMFVTTLGYYEEGDGGGGIYKAVNSNPSYTSNVNKKTDATSDTWLKLLHNGTVNIRQAGAKGDGLGSLSSTSGTDDTDAIQQVLDMAIDGVISTVEIPPGVFNFTQLKCYDPVVHDGTRGNFAIVGANHVNDYALIFNYTNDGSILKCIEDFADPAFDINAAIVTGTDAGDVYDVDYVIRGVVIKNLSIIGRAKKLISADYTNDCLFENLTIINNPTNVAATSNHAVIVSGGYNTTWKNISVMGSRVINSVDVPGTYPMADNSYGFSITTNQSVGGGLIVDGLDIRGFNTGLFISHLANVTDAESYSGLENAWFNKVNCTLNRTNLSIGKYETNMTNRTMTYGDATTVDGKGLIIIPFENSYFTTPYDTTGYNIELQHNASVRFLRCTFTDYAGNDQTMINVANEYAFSGEIIKRSSEGGVIQIEDSFVRFHADQKFIYLSSDKSYYRVSLQRINGLTTLNSTTGLVKVNDTTAFRGRVLLKDINFQGITDVSHANMVKFYCQDNSGGAALKFVDSDSSVPWMLDNVITTGTISFANRPYLPKYLRVDLSGGNVTVTLPSGLSLYTSATTEQTVTDLYKPTYVYVKAATNNLIFSLPENTKTQIAQHISNAAPVAEGNGPITITAPDVGNIFELTPVHGANSKLTWIIRHFVVS